MEKMDSCERTHPKEPDAPRSPPRRSPRFTNKGGAAAPGVSAPHAATLPANPPPAVAVSADNGPTQPAICLPAAPAHACTAAAPTGTLTASTASAPTGAHAHAALTANAAHATPSLLRSGSSPRRPRGRQPGLPAPRKSCPACGEKVPNASKSCPLIGCDYRWAPSASQRRAPARLPSARTQRYERRASCTPPHTGTPQPARPATPGQLHFVPDGEIPACKDIAKALAEDLPEQGKFIRGTPTTHTARQIPHAADPDLPIQPLSLVQLDPLPRFPHDAQVQRTNFAPLYAAELDPGVKYVADIIAGLDPACAFLQLPIVLPTHTRSVKGQVAGVVEEVSRKALAYLEAGDDRPLAFVNHYLIPCILAHDPTTCTHTTSTAKRQYDRRMVELRIAAYRAHGWSAFALMLDDYRTMAAQRSARAAAAPQPEAPNPARNLERVVAATQRGVKMKDALERAVNTEIDINKISEFIRQSSVKPEGGWRPDQGPGVSHWDPPGELTLPEEDDSSQGKNRGEILKVASKFFRGLRHDAAAYCDGLHNLTIDLALRSERALAAHTSLALALNSDAIISISRSYANMARTDSEFNTSTSLCLSLAARSRGRVIPKPNKPGKFRTIEIGTYISNFFGALTTQLFRKESVKACAADQLAGQPSGPDAAVLAMQQIAAMHDSHYARVELDVASHYPSCSDEVIGRVTAAHCPPLLRTAMVTSVPRVVTIVNLDGGEAAAYERTAGRGQGSRASTVLCNLVVARVCADARAILLNNSKSHPDKDNPPVCFAVADNIFGLIHVTRVAEFYDVFHKVGGEYGLEFGDHAVHLHGTVAERNTAAQVIAARPTGCGIDLDNTIKRPDLTKKGADLAIVMGVPISNGPEEAAARLDWVDTRIAATQERLNTLLALRDSACVAADPATTTNHITQSASAGAFSACVYGARGLDHIAKTCRATDFPGLFTKFDNTIMTGLVAAARLPTDIPTARYQGAFQRCPAAGGAGARPAQLIAAPARLAALTAAAPLVHKVLGLSDYLPADAWLRQEMEGAVKNIELSIKTSSNNLTEAIKSSGISTPLPSSIKMGDSMGQDIINTITKALHPMINNDSMPKRYKQRDVLRYLDWIQLQIEYHNPNCEYFPSTWETPRRARFMRTILERNVARNGCALWKLTYATRDPFTHNKSLTILKESEWQMAVRQQLGLGAADIIGRPPRNITCSCHRHTTSDPFTDQHLKGCSHGKGFISNAHKNIQNELAALAGHAGYFKGANGITAPTSKSGKVMDLVLVDPETSVTFHIDIRRTDSLGQTHQASPLCRSARNNCFREITADKANSYAAESARLNASLTPFAVDANGSFQRRDPTFNPANKLDPSIILKQILPGGAAAASYSGTLGISVEEGILKRLARSAANPRTGLGAYDALLDFKSAAGHIKTAAARKIAYAAIRGTARSAIAALKRQHTEGAWV